MHNAPSVTYPVGRSFFQAALPVGLALLSAGLGLGWAFSSGHSGAAQGAMLLLWLLAAATAAWGWRRPAHGELQWDGQDWVWHDGTRPELGRVVVRLDWQRGLLLAFRGVSGTRQWLWLARESDSSRWLALRRALYAAPRPAAPPDAGGLAP